MVNNSIPDGSKLFLVLWKAWHAIEAHDRTSIAATGLARTDFAALEVLLHKGALPVNTIARKVLLTSGSMTTAVDRLEARGLVRRTDSPSDGRVTLVDLTTEGRSLISQAYAGHSRRLDHWAEILNPDERIQLETLLKKVGHHAASLQADQPTPNLAEEETPHEDEGLAFNLL